jgi:ABC-type glycerol-3-phosphate transport system substrate-binding protein
MKNLFKFGFLALAISLSVAACSSNKTEEAATDSTAVDSTAVDTTAADSTATDSVAADSAATK